MKVHPCTGHSYGDRAVCTLIIVKNMGNKGKNCEAFSFRGGGWTATILTQNQFLPDFIWEIIQAFICGKRQRTKKHECCFFFLLHILHFPLFFLHIAIYNRLMRGDLQEPKVNFMFFQKPHVGGHEEPRDQVKLSDAKALGHITCAPAVGESSLPSSLHNLLLALIGSTRKDVSFVYWLSYNCFQKGSS